MIVEPIKTRVFKEGENLFAFISGQNFTGNNLAEKYICVEMWG